MSGYALVEVGPVEPWLRPHLPIVLNSEVIRKPSVGLDEIAKCMLVSLREGPKSSEALALTCGGGSTRMTSPRAIWLAGLGLIDEVGLGIFKLTDVGLAFLRVVEEQPV